MNNPNPLIPQGSFQQQSRGKSNIKIAVFTILAIHVVLLGGLLMQGCKRGGDTPAEQTSQVQEPPPMTNEVPNLPPPVAERPPATPAVPAAVPVVTPQAAPLLPAAVEPPATDGKTHVIAKNETLSDIALKYHVSVKAIQEANPGLNPLRLQIGQKINIPPPSTAAASPPPAPAPAAPNVTPTAAARTVVKNASTPSNGATASESVDGRVEGRNDGDIIIYTVKEGDALEKIARNHGTTVKTIRSLNNLRTDRINVGDKLKIPARTVQYGTPSGTVTKP